MIGMNKYVESVKAVAQFEKIKKFKNYWKNTQMNDIITYKK